MATIGERASLKILHEKSFGLFLDGGELGEILLPHREVPHGSCIGEALDVFLYNDSEDRPVATLLRPKVMPGQFAKLKCVAVTGVGAFLDWGLPKDLLVPFREQKLRMEVGKNYLAHVHLDEQTGRIIASTRLVRYLDQGPHSFYPGQSVDLMAYGKTDLGYKAIINGSHSGLIFTNDVFQPQILNELVARGGFWPLGDHSPAAEINDELGVSKRTFKQATGALFRKGKITIEQTGIRLFRDLE
jgi:uncharacterized protein